MKCVTAATCNVTHRQLLHSDQILRRPTTSTHCRLSIGWRQQHEMISNNIKRWCQTIVFTFLLSFVLISAVFIVDVIETNKVYVCDQCLITHYIRGSQPVVSAPLGGVRCTSRGCETHSWEVIQKFEIRCPTACVADLILIISDGGVSNQLGLTEEYQAQNKVGNPCSKIQVLICCLLLPVTRGRWWQWYSVCWWRCNCVVGKQAAAVSSVSRNQCAGNSCRTGW